LIYKTYLHFIKLIQQDGDLNTVILSNKRTLSFPQIEVVQQPVCLYIQLSQDSIMIPEQKSVSFKTKEKMHFI